MTLMNSTCMKLTTSIFGIPIHDSCTSRGCKNDEYFILEDITLDFVGNIQESINRFFTHAKCNKCSQIIKRKIAQNWHSKYILIKFGQNQVKYIYLSTIYIGLVNKRFYFVGYKSDKHKYQLEIRFIY